MAGVQQLVPDLAEALGPDTEIVLHDLNRLPNSIVDIAGNLTGRQEGGPATNLLLQVLRQGNTNNVLNARSETSNGRILRSSTLFIKDEEDCAIGCLCFNTDVTDGLEIRDFISKHFIGIEAEEKNSVAKESSELFSQDVEELKREMVRKAVENVGVPISLMRKEHKLQVTKALDEAGLFLIRGAAEYVAQALDVTRYTIYNYRGSVRVSDELAAQSAPSSSQDDK
jgi:predicted transcriptional regulator YheO